MNSKAKVKSKDQQYYPSLKREGSYLLIAIITAGISLSLDYSPCRIDTSWFQRSGSLLVILGVLCEGKYVAKTIQEDVVAMGLGGVSIKQKLAIHIGLIIAIIGTLIWGYGDLISKHS